MKPRGFEMSEMYRSHLSGYRMSPRKVRLVVDLIRGKHVQEALDILRFTNKKMAPVLMKMVYSAVANAQQVATVDVDSLFIGEVFVDQGTTLKRFMPRAQGRAASIKKRSSHITLTLVELT
jgi:large subunit ribosomal protein L22